MPLSSTALPGAGPATLRLVCGLAFVFAACGEPAAITPTATDDAEQIGGVLSAKKDAGSHDVAPLDVAARAGQPGEVCAGDVQCANGFCGAGTCATACKAHVECGDGKECTSDDGKRLFCHAPAYNAEIGVSCAVTGKCEVGLECVLSKESAAAYCTDLCAADSDCPATFACTENADGARMCAPRSFCSECLHDEQCPGTGRCVEHALTASNSGARFCSRGCNPGSTECPRYADCVKVGDDEFQCLHRAGTCIGKGELCAPCQNGNDGSQCQEGAMCLTYQSTKESFCSQACSKTAKCPASYSCQEISTSAGKVGQCVPTDPKAQRCVSKTTPTMEKGDIMDDFQMVGYVDTNKDGLLSDETVPQVTRLSDYQDKKAILLTISAGWCGPCRVETKTFKALQTKYKNLQIFQTLYHGPKQPSTPTLAFAKQWIKELNAVGAVGVDVYNESGIYNTNNTSPLNILMDAKTRRVLVKWNGGQPADGYVAPHVK